MSVWWCTEKSLHWENCIGVVKFSVLNPDLEPHLQFSKWQWAVIQCSALPANGMEGIGSYGCLLVQKISQCGAKVRKTKFFCSVIDGYPPYTWTVCEVDGCVVVNCEGANGKRNQVLITGTELRSDGKVVRDRTHIAR